MLVLTLGFTAAVQSILVFTRVPSLKQAAFVTPGFATTRGTFWHLYPPLHSDIRRENPRYPIICYIGNPDVLTMSPVADSDGVCSWSCNSRSLPLPHKELLRPAIICNHIPWGSYHWGTELGYNTRCGVWRAAVPIFDCISTSHHCQHSRTLSIRPVYAHHNATRRLATVDRQGTASGERRFY